MKKVERSGVTYELINPNIIEVTKDDKRLGDIFPNEGDWQLILDGADPIKDEWEDGNGHILSIDGWGESE